MTYQEFQDTVTEMLAEIPEIYKKGLQGVHVLPQAHPEPDLPGVFRLGEYMDPGPEAFLGSNPGLGRHIALYYGSFLAIARNSPQFDWEAQIWETLTHELRHHVESLAGDGSLIEEDRQRTAEFRRRLGKLGKR